MKNHHLLNGSHGPIKAGTTILVEKPFAFILSAKEQGLRCDHCFAKGKVLKCSGCQHIHYCGRCCQKEAWPEHKAECAGYRKVLPRVPPDAARLMARLIRKLASGGSHQRGYYTKTSFRLWKDLMSHSHDLKVDSRRMEHFMSLCAVLFQFLTDISLPNFEELMGIYGRMCINGFTILDLEMLAIGTGIYLGTSILDHNCNPNAVAVDWWICHLWIGQRSLLNRVENVVYTYRKVITLSWLPTPPLVHLLHISRANGNTVELQSSYYFLCQCEVCLDTHQISLMHAAQCPNKNCDYPVQIPWREDIQIVIRSDENKSQNCNGESSQQNSNTSDDSQNDGSNHRQFKTDGPETNGEGPHENGAMLDGSLPSNGCDSIGCNEKDDKLANCFNSMSMKENGSCNGYTDTDDYLLECPKCRETISEDFVKQFKSVMDFTFLHLQNMRDMSITYVDACRSCLEKQTGVLHPLSLFHVQTLDLAMDSCVQYELWEQAMKYARLLLPGFKNYYREKHPMYGLLLLKLGKLQLYVDKPIEALESLKAAAKILRITHGTQHQLWRDSLVPLLRQAEAETSAVINYR